MEPFDTDTFIAEIQAEAAIWDYKSDLYRNRIQKTKAWEKIGGLYHENFQELSSKEKNDIAANLQRKWKSLRDSYNRELKILKKVETGEGASKKKKYIYFEQLSFLEPLAQQKETTSTLDDIGGGEDLSDIVDGLTAEKVLLPRKNNGPKKSKANKDDELNEVLKEKFSKKQTVEPTNVSQDADTLFCLSLVTDFRKIVDDLKSDTKCEVLQVLNKYKRLSVSHYGHSSTHS